MPPSETDVSKSEKKNKSKPFCNDLELRFDLKGLFQPKLLFVSQKIALKQCIHFFLPFPGLHHPSGQAHLHFKVDNLLAEARYP